MIFKKGILSPTLTILLSLMLLFIYCDNNPKSELDNYPVKYIKDYIADTKNEYKFEIVDSLFYSESKLYSLKMTSGKWLSDKVVSDSIWWHMVDVIIPNDISSDNALLFIGGGSKNDKKIFLDTTTIKKAQEIKSVIAHVSNIPFQPIAFKDNDTVNRYEDNLIAYGWDKFLSNGAKDSDKLFLARFPMTRGVVRAMDLIEEITSNKTIPVKKFFIAGASKRGWTAWTTAAVDNRVMGFSPVVIDVLNSVPSFQHHYKSYGAWSPAVQDYVDFDIMDWMGTKEFEKLLDIVEPYEFIKLYKQPKLVINGTIDEFFLPDSWKFYWKDLPEVKYLQYVPNGNHGLKGSYATRNIFSFYYHLINDLPIPKLEWEIADNFFEINLNPNLDYEINLWKANSSKRDFRIWEIGRSWTKTKIKKSDTGSYRIEAPTGSGYTASLIEVTFNKNSKNPLIFSSGTIVLPDKYDFNAYDPKKK